MRALIGPSLLTNPRTKPCKKPFEIYDVRLAGFVLRVQPSGVRAPTTRDSVAIGALPWVRSERSVRTKPASNASGFWAT